MMSNGASDAPGLVWEPCGTQSRRRGLMRH